MHIRAYRPGDEAALYDICLRTGDQGGDATGLFADPRLPGEVWVGPYLRLAPGFASVLVDEAPVGYVLGTPDSLAFERGCERLVWPDLRARYPDPGPAPVPGEPGDARAARLIHHPWRTSPEIAARYPAHLHIDLLPVAQGRGFGRLLLQRLFTALHEAGAIGVHLGVAAANTRAYGFYRALGFDELRRWPGGVLMGRSLGAAPPRRGSGSALSRV
jgi:GNAT superfamily N-acetyltransferase